MKEEKSPWIWKAAMVALPTGLALSAVIAMAIKVNKGPQTGMEAVTYSATDFDVANLRDAVNKVGDVIGARDFETASGQQSMRQVIALINGSLSSINLGYQVKSDEGSVKAGRIWKNYWVDSSEDSEDGTLVVWCSYSDREESASVAALLSVAEWLRGREFERRVRVAFVREGEGLSEVTADLSEKEDQVRFWVSGLGRGSQGLLKTGGATKADRELAFYRFMGENPVTTESDWKMTIAWEHFEAQVRELCEAISEEAGEKVVFRK